MRDGADRTMKPLNGLFDKFRRKLYARREPLVLINGLAEQAESWFANRRYWMKHFDVYVPQVLVFDGQIIQDMVVRKEPITVDYLVEQFRTFIVRYVQHTPVHIVASSLGGKVAVALAAKYPELIKRMVLLCPSGMGDEEKLPIMEGVRGRDTYALVRSVFHRPRFVNQDMLRFYKRQMADRKWKLGLLRSVRGTLEESVRGRMKDVRAKTLLVTGREDRICCPKTAALAAQELPDGQFLEIPKCGHAPQIEKHWLINRLVVHFLTSPRPSANPRFSQLLLTKPRRVSI